MISAQCTGILLDVVDLDHLHVLVLREHLLHAVEPPLQVGRAEARDDRHLALPAEQRHRLFGQDAAGRQVVDAVERQPLRLRRVGVPGRDRDAGVHRAVDRLGEEVAVQARDRDAVDLLRDERFEDLLLLELVGALGPAPDHLDVAEPGGLALGADLRVVEDRECRAPSESPRRASAQPARLPRRRARLPVPHDPGHGDSEQDRTEPFHASARPPLPARSRSSWSITTMTITTRPTMSRS